MSKSIMHSKADGTCYLCMLLNHDYQRRTGLHEHHVFMGNKHKKLAEHYGLKVYLCLQHHEVGNMAVHNNREVSELIQRKGQEIFEKNHTREEWMAIFGKNYIL